MIADWVPPGVRRKRFRRKVRQRQKLHRRRGGQRHWRSARSRRPLSFVALAAPRFINLEKHTYRGATLGFCRRIRQAYLQDGNDVILDFSGTRSITAMGMLAVVAEVDRSQRMGKSDQVFRCRLPEDKCEQSRIVRQVLDQVKLLERTGHPQLHAPDAVFHESVRHWRYATGTRIDEKPSDVLGEHEGRISPAVMEGMQIGLAEAILNSIHHAYQRPREDGCRQFQEKRWWMFTQELDGDLHVVVCDLGMGIPRSLPLRWKKAVLKKLTSAFTLDAGDVAAIKTALIVGETSTGEENRGKGLPQIWAAIQESENGSVGIMSGKAFVGMDEGRVTSGPYDVSMLGTLITWRVPIEQTDGEGNE